jgi:hypothetical protein
VLFTEVPRSWILGSWTSGVRNSRKGARRVTRARLRLSRDAARRSPCDGGLLDQRTDVRGVPGLCLVRRLSPAWVAGGAPVDCGDDFLGVPDRAAVVLPAGGRGAWRASPPADFGGAGLPGCVLPRLLGDRLAAYDLLSCLLTGLRGIGIFGSLHPGSCIALVLCPTHP